MEHLILGRPSRRAAVTAAPHLSVDDVASLIDGTLAPDERDRAELHLAVCDDCREELATCSRIVAGGAPAPARRLPWRYVIPLAAGIILVVMIRRPAGKERIGDAPERAAASAGSRIVTVAPATGASVGPGALRFIWHPIDGSIGYRVVVKDASGAPVWTGDAADTSIALPDSVRLSASTLYVWRVDGQRADGTTASSAEAGLRIAR